MLSFRIQLQTIKFGSANSLLSDVFVMSHAAEGWRGGRGLGRDNIKGKASAERGIFSNRLLSRGI